MNRDRIYLFDTTLRDGAQTLGVDFSVEDKRIIAKELDKLGIDYVEGGWPGANPVDSEFFDNPPQLKNAKFTAFGMTKRAGRSASNDPGLKAVIGCGAPVVCLVAKTWDYHVTTALGLELDENFDLIADSVKEATKYAEEVIMDAEHFFDGYKANPEFAVKCLKTAVEAGARWVVLCDTNGGTMPDEIEDICKAVCAEVPGDKLGIHCHNDTENAVANSLAAVRTGIRMVQGTLNGLGERCGNANLVSIIPSLVLKKTYADQFDAGIDAEGLKHLTHCSRLLDDLLNRNPNRHQPFVGESAFAHKGGLHVSAVLKNPDTYEHIPPETVGNQRYIPMSNQAGRSNVLAQFEAVGIEVDPKDERVNTLLDMVKEREAQGWAYDSAPASFEVLARRQLGLMPEYFNVENFKVIVEQRFNAMGELVDSATATVKVHVGEDLYHNVAESSEGPVNALYRALHKDLGKYSNYIDDLRLVNFKVRILDRGTEAVTRVLIEFEDSKDNTWFTIGVSPNIIQASFKALVDSINYKLLREDAPAAAE